MKPAFAASWTLVFAVTSLALAQTTKPAATQPADVALSNVRLQTLAPRTFLYIPTETTLADLPAVVGQTVTTLMREVAENKVEVAGPIIFVYEGMTGEPNKPFKLQIGLVVADDTKAPHGTKVRGMPAYKALTILHSGPMPTIGQAYQKLMPAVFAQHQQPSGESREYYLYWEGPQSVNNVTLVAMGLK